MVRSDLISNGSIATAARGIILGAAVQFVAGPILTAEPTAPPPSERTSATASRRMQPVTPHQGLRLPEIPIHDPWMFADETTKTYYLYTATRRDASGAPRAGVVTYKSSDLKTWDGPYLVFSVPDGIWANPLEGAWAPEVHRYRGKYYLLVTLHNSARVIDRPPDSWQLTHMRGTIVAESDSLEGPFVPVKPAGPHPPADFMTLDGTLYVEEGKPWMVYAHEWVQMIDGTMEAIPLRDDLSDAAGEPIHLFKASDAPWINAERKPAKRKIDYVTDGPELFRTKTGELLMLWSSYNRRGYVETLARSESGKLAGPWKQLEPLLGDDSGHGMLFHTFDGQLMLVLHHPFRNARTWLYDMEDMGDGLKVVRPRPDLDGRPPSPAADSSR